MVRHEGATPDNEWPQEAIDYLRELWPDHSISSAEIGRRLCELMRDCRYSKNAVVGKAHRLDLPPRPSPIKRDGAAPSRKVLKPKGSTLPPLQSRPLEVRPTAAKSVLIPLPPTAATAVLIPRPTPKVPSEVRTCCFPVSEQTEPRHRFLFCEEAALEKSSYCEAHHNKCYIGKRVPDERELAVAVG